MPAPNQMTAGDRPAARDSGEPARNVTVRRLLRALWRDKLMLFPLLFLVALIAAAVGADLIAPHDPFDQNLRSRNAPPMASTTSEISSFPYLLGADPLGRDLFSRLIYGARVSLAVGLSSVLASGTLGVLLGLMAGYHRGWLDDVVMRGVDVLMGIPGLLLALFILFLVGTGFWNLVIVFAVTRWMIYARVTRGLTLSFREQPFVEGAQTIGCSDSRIIFRHILPNLASPILVLATLEIAIVILAEAGLSFLGMGIQPPAPTWGRMVAEGRDYITSAWWLITFPGLAILLTALSLNLTAAWLRMISDPVQRWRWFIGRPASRREADTELALAFSEPRSRRADTERSEPAHRPAANGDHLLEVIDLRVNFRTPDGLLNAVNGISYTLNRGQTLAILGESGSGKTVSAEAVMGILDSPPAFVTGGSVLFDGVDLLQVSPSERRRLCGERIAMIFQDPLTALNPAYTVGSQIAGMFQEHRGTSKREATAKAVELMDRVRIPSARERAHDYPHQFSGGMRQRVMIAAAIALDPDLLIADEPTTALDVTVQAQIMELLAELQTETGMGLILITHDLGVVADVADNVAVMYAGKIVETGPIEDIYSCPAHPYTKGLLESAPRVDRKMDSLRQISGAPPNMRFIPSGCPFHPRCAYVVDRCSVEPPPLYEVQPERSASCHRFEDVMYVN